MHCAVEKFRKVVQDLFEPQISSKDCRVFENEDVRSVTSDGMVQVSPTCGASGTGRPRETAPAGRTRQTDVPRHHCSPCSSERRSFPEVRHDLVLAPVAGRLPGATTATSTGCSAG